VQAVRRVERSSLETGAEPERVARRRPEERVRRPDLAGKRKEEGQYNEENVGEGKENGKETYGGRRGWW
jgi:hypothetical protein